MKLKMTIVASFLLSSLAGAAPAEVTTVLLPNSAPAQIHIQRPGGNDSACLSFDLSGLAESAKEGLSVELRLVGFRSPDQRFPQIVQVFKGCNPLPSADPIGGWRVQGESATEAILKSSVSDESDNNKVGLARTVKEAMGGELQLLIRAVDDETDWKYASLETSYGLENGQLEAYKFEDEKFQSSTRPRLILNYKAPTQQADAPRKFGRPRSQLLEELQSFTKIVSGPLRYQDKLIVIAKTSASAFELVSLEPDGTILWKCPIQGRIGQTGVTAQLGEHSVIDGQGGLYNFGTSAVTVYALKSGCPAGGYPSSQVANPRGSVPQGRPTVSAGDNIYLIAEGQENSVYALASGSLQELWRSEKRAGTQVKRLAVSGDTVYALTPELLRLDAATGMALDPLEGWTADPNWKPYRPLVSPGTEADYVVLAATGADHGRMTAFSGEEEVWKHEGPLAAQPTLVKATAGTALLTIQNQRFIRLRLEDGKQICASEREPRLVCHQDNVSACTSNLVVGADGSAYFLSGATFYAYDKDCKQSFAIAAGVQNDLLFPSDNNLVTRSDNTLSALRDTDWRLKAKQIAAGLAHRCSILGDGSLKCWGDNFGGVLGLGDEQSRGQSWAMGDYLKAVDLGRGRKVARIVAGSYHSCALFDDGAVKCWGRNYAGQLGLGHENDRGGHSNEMGEALKPVDLGSGRKVSQIAVGGSHNCAVLDDGSVKCWGRNYFGQLGQRDKNDRGDQPNEMGDALKPVDLGRGRRVTQLTAGWEHSCALLEDGSVKCWGFNGRYGTLGRGDTQPFFDEPYEMGDALKPVDLGNGRKATQIEAGGYFNCAILDDRSTKCWGSNGSGTLGQGDTEDRGDQPNEMGDALKTVDFGFGRTAVQISAFQDFACALLDDASVKCWGQNRAGQLGQGDVNNRGDEPNEMGDALKPVDLGSGRTATHVAVGGEVACAILDDGSLKCWGGNSLSPLGLEGMENRGDDSDEMGDALPAINLGSGPNR